jgi:ankyrin repeat protein
MDRMDRFNALYLNSYDGVECPTAEEANGYLKDGNTMIISAVRNNGVSFELRKKKILWLISCGADANKQDCSRRYFPPLTHAVQKNDYEMTEFLLKDCHANPNVGSRNPFDSGYVRHKNEGNMPLMVAAWHNKPEFVKELCADERTSLNQQDGNGFTALIKACGNGFLECRDIIRNAGADTKIVDRDGQTADDRYNEFLETGLRMNRNYDEKNDVPNWGGTRNSNYGKRR